MLIWLVGNGDKDATSLLNRTLEARYLDIIRNNKTRLGIQDPPSEEGLKPSPMSRLDNVRREQRGTDPESSRLLEEERDSLELVSMSGGSSGLPEPEHNHNDRASKANEQVPDNEQ